MPSFVPTSAETFADAERYTQARLVDVRCLDCLAHVRVKKNSEHHTSIQWTAEAMTACPQLCRTSPSDDRDKHRGCPRLAASIDAAVRAGEVPVGAEDGY